MAPSVRSFADDIRGRSDDELAALILSRPDLAHPAPADLAALAGRAATRASLARALDHIAADEFRALEAHLVAADISASPAALLGVSERALRPLSSRLWEQALLWRERGRLRPVRALFDVLQHPAGLGPSADQLHVSLPADPAVALAALSPASAALIDRLRWHNWRATLADDTARAAGQELARAGLAAVVDGSVMLPREVSIVARDGRLYEHGLSAPQLHPRTLGVAAVDTTGAGSALELLWVTSELGRALEADQPRVLRSGGLSVRDHKALATRLDAPADFVAFALEIAYAAELFAPDHEADPSFLPTHAYDEWLASPRADRWAMLARAWWTTLRAPALAGQHGAEGGIVNVLGPDAVWPMMRARRHEVLELLAELDPGSVLATPQIEAGLRWHRPVRLAGDTPTHADDVIREAGWLGLVALGGLTTAGRALVNGGDPAAALAPSLPEPVDQVVLQADLTAVAPGPLNDDLDDLMRLTADIESRGGATVFRFSDNSVRRAFDQGLDARELRERLGRASATPIPQPLDYLIGDVARRHGQLRVGSVSSYLRSDDSALLDLLSADPGLRTLQLRRIAPTVLVSPAPAGTVLNLVREHHQGAVAETSDGGVVLTHAPSDRAPMPLATPATVIRSRDSSDVTALVADLRAAEAQTERVDHEGPRIPNTDPTLTVTMILDAVADGRAVWIGYVDASGTLQRMLFHPTQVEGGRVFGSADGGSSGRAIAVHRITGVAPAG